MKRFLFALAVLLLTTPPAFAQYDSSWASLPLTPALQEVRAMIDAGLCGQDAVNAINGRGHVAAVFVKQGGSGPFGVVQWYDKPLPPPWDHCGASKFQFFGADGPYAQGWEVGLWSPNWTTQPPLWRLNPYAPPLPGYTPPPAPPPVVTPPPAPLPSLDIQAAIDRAVTRLEAAIAADGDLTRQRVDAPGWFERLAKNPAVIAAVSAIGSYFTTKALTK